MFAHHQPLPLFPNAVPAPTIGGVLFLLVRSRRRKLHIVRFRVNPKAHSFRCSSSSHKICDFAGTLLWRYFSEKHIPFGRSFNFQGTREDPLTYLELHPQMTPCFEKIPFTYLHKGWKNAHPNPKFSLHLFSQGDTIWGL